MQRKGLVENAEIKCYRHKDDLDERFIKEVLLDLVHSSEKNCFKWLTHFEKGIFLLSIHFPMLMFISVFRREFRISCELQMSK